uniref:Uncharacterized protein n=1 Tax=Caenorhabditis japonica TaxID=281687 RepID=A0A8R1EVD0_CAEJA
MFERSLADTNKVNQLLQHVDATSAPVAVYRIGRQKEDGRPRLLKVVMSSQFSQRDLRRANDITNSIKIFTHNAALMSNLGTAAEELAHSRQHGPRSEGIVQLGAAWFAVSRMETEVKSHKYHKETP